jgi:hypothetical protein
VVNALPKEGRRVETISHVPCTLRPPAKIHETTALITKVKPHNNAPNSTTATRAIPASGQGKMEGQQEQRTTITTVNVTVPAIEGPPWSVKNFVPAKVMPRVPWDQIEPGRAPTKPDQGVVSHVVESVPEMTKTNTRREGPNRGPQGATEHQTETPRKQSHPATRGPNTGTPTMAPKAQNPRAHKRKVRSKQVAAEGVGAVVDRGQVITAIVVVASVTTSPAHKRTKGRVKRRGVGAGVKQNGTKDVAAKGEVTIAVDREGKPTKAARPTRPARQMDAHGVHPTARSTHG